MQLPITIGLHRSSFGAAVFLAIHGLAAAAVLATPWIGWLRIVLLGSLLLSIGLCGRLWNPAVLGLRLREDGQIECRPAGSDEFHAAELMPGATVHPWLTVIRLRYSNGKAIAVILPDSAAAEDFRRLRVWLRWRADFSGRRDAA